MHGGGIAIAVEGIKAEIDSLMYGGVDSHIKTTMKFSSIFANSFSSK